MRFVFALLFWTLPAFADPLAAVAAAAQGSFDQMPRVRTVDQIAGRCGADDTVSRHVVYCTSQNVIFVSRDAAAQAQTAYLLAHSFGHAVQVRHGVADVALAAIRARRSEEPMLRGLVERQNDCIAGFLFARAGLAPVDLRDWFATDPLDGIHWGRNPLTIGPRASVEVAARDRWFRIGQEGDIAQCGPGEFTADLLVAALRD